jgi:uncharacterized membrane protein
LGYEKDNFFEIAANQLLGFGRSTFAGNVRCISMDVMWSRLQYFAQKLLIIGGVIELIMCGILLPKQVATITTLVILLIIGVSVLLCGYHLKNVTENNARQF